MANRILVDTGFWYAVFDKRDCHRAQAIEILEKYFDNTAYEIAVPFLQRQEFIRKDKTLKKEKKLRGMRIVS